MRKQSLFAGHYLPTYNNDSSIRPDPMIIFFLVKEETFCFAVVTFSEPKLRLASIKSVLYPGFFQLTFRSRFCNLLLLLFIASKEIIDAVGMLPSLTRPNFQTTRNLHQ